MSRMPVENMGHCESVLNPQRANQIRMIDV